MVEAGDWTTTKLISLILGIVLLMFIVVGFITGAIDPLIQQIGAKYDEWILKIEKQDEDLTPSGNFKVNPDGTCELLNYGSGNNNYTFNYYTKEIYQNGTLRKNAVIYNKVRSLNEIDKLNEIYNILKPHVLSQNQNIGQKINIGNIEYTLNITSSKEPENPREIYTFTNSSGQGYALQRVNYSESIFQNLATIVESYNFWPGSIYSGITTIRPIRLLLCSFVKDTGEYYFSSIHGEGQELYVLPREDFIKMLEINEAYKFLEKNCI